MPGAMARVIEILQANRSLEAFWANYRIAVYPADWPENSVGGYTGNFFRLNVNTTEDRQVTMWQEFLRHESGLCTGMYAHIIRRRVWVDYWEKRTFHPSRMPTMNLAFPHNVMFASTLMRTPSYFIGQPVLTTFWGSQYGLSVNSLIWLFCYPPLLRLYHKKGLSGSQLSDCVREVFRFCFAMLEDRLRDESIPPLRTLQHFLRGAWYYPAAWKVVAQSIRKAGKPQLLDVILRTLAKVNQWFPVVDPWKSRAPR